MDHRQTARERIEGILAQLETQPAHASVVRLTDECEALIRAISAFHMEGIRFRMFNVDRLLTHGGLQLSPEVTALFADARRELEAAGFHTRSHQAPG